MAGTAASAHLVGRLANAGAHPALRRLELFPRLNGDRILTLAGDDAQGKWEKGRLQWYRLAIVVRTIGWCAGAVFGISLTVTIVGFLILASVRADSALIGFGVVMAFVILWSGAVWLYLYWMVGVAAPSTRFAVHVRVLSNQSSPGRSGRLSRAEITFSLDTVGKLGRVFFRAITRRTMNVGVRPDLAADVAQLAQRIMLDIPQGGLDELRRRPDDLAEYREFVRDVLGLLVVQRLDVIRRLADEQKPGLLMQGVVSDEMRLYLQPLARRTAIEAFTEFVLPVLALVISIVALVVSAVSA